MKFGGSSLGTGQRMLHVAGIIKEFSQKEQVVVVASAIYKVTDKLVSIFQKYKAENYKGAFEEIRLLYKIHKHALSDLGLPKEQHAHLEKVLTKLFGNLSIYLVVNNSYSVIDYDYCISFGERLSSRLLAAALRKIEINAKAIDASRVIIANDDFSDAKVLIEETKIQVEKSLHPLFSQKVIPVITGFFAATTSGEVITLGRGGSDYSATILANVLDAKEVILWKEVDGVYSGDPKKDKQAIFYPELTYQEALSLAKTGAKVLHPEAMKPVASKEIIVRVKNTFKPDFIGTKIWKGA